MIKIIKYILTCLHAYQSPESWAGRMRVLAVKYNEKSVQGDRNAFNQEYNGCLGEIESRAKKGSRDYVFYHTMDTAFFEKEMIRNLRKEGFYVTKGYEGMSLKIFW